MPNKIYFERGMGVGLKCFIENFMSYLIETRKSSFIFVVCLALLDFVGVN